MQQAARVLSRARTLFCSHPASSSRRRVGLSIPGLQNGLQLIRTELHQPHFQRHFTSANGCRNSPLRPLYRLQLTTITNGRRLGLIVGGIVGANYLCRKEGLANIARCENDKSHKRPPPSSVVANWDYWQSQFGQAVKRLWVPSLCVLTISLGWHYPVSLLVNLLFLMWSTKPSPSSIYVWVEQMHQQESLRASGLDRMKIQAAGVMHVEVNDNTLFCLAKVTSVTKKSILLGFLGDWWVIYSSSSAIHTGVNLRNLIPDVGPFTRDQFK